MNKTQRQEEKETTDLFNHLVENEYFTEDELILLTTINGYSIKTLHDAIFARYGYKVLWGFINKVI